jgi:hypothetical protein
MARQSGQDQQMRLRIAQEAARLIAEEGVHDFLVAKRKAAQHLGAPDTRHMPRNQEVEEALLSYQRLFQSDTQPQQLEKLRSEALTAMRFFEKFRPRLVGSVLAGTATTYTEITLHVFADTPKELTFFLMENQIPFDTVQRRFRFERDSWVEMPAFRFIAGDYMLELVVFPLDGRREAPRSPIDGKPMERAGVSAVEALLQEIEQQIG